MRPWPASVPPDFTVNALLLSVLSSTKVPLVTVVASMLVTLVFHVHEPTACTSSELKFEKALLTVPLP